MSLCGWMRGSLKDETMYESRAHIVFERRLLRHIRLIQTNAPACNVTMIPDINPISVSKTWILYHGKLRRPTWMNNTSILMLALLPYSLSVEYIRFVFASVNVSSTYVADSNRIVCFKVYNCFVVGMLLFLVSKYTVCEMCMRLNLLSADKRCKLTAIVTLVHRLGRLGIK